MSANHTKGPWNNYQGDDIYCVYDADGKKICTIEPVDIVGWNAVHREEADANEALIAAAPELLEALDKLVNCISETRGPDASDALDCALSAIAKARGES